MMKGSLSKAKAEVEKAKAEINQKERARVKESSIQPLFTQISLIH